MDARRMTHRLAEVIDAHDWATLPALLHDDFTCRLVHTGEVLGKHDWVQLNADYPGFERFVLEEVVADDDRAVSRALVTGTTDGVERQFGVASFVTVRSGLVAELTEVWCDIGVEPPPGTRG
ncbi:MAG: nuclear transport factor 2 family protein [Phycicoccus sp.]